VTVTAAALGGALAKGSVPVDNVTPGVLGFLIVAGMGIALYFLLRSMSRQLKKIPPPPPEDGDAGGADPPGSTVITGSRPSRGNRR